MKHLKVEKLKALPLLKTYWTIVWIYLFCRLKWVEQKTINSPIFYIYLNISYQREHHKTSNKFSPIPNGHWLNWARYCRLNTQLPSNPYQHVIICESMFQLWNVYHIRMEKHEFVFFFFSFFIHSLLFFSFFFHRFNFSFIFILYYIPIGYLFYMSISLLCI